MRLRAPVPDDAPAVLAVLAERDRVDLGAPDYSLEDLREEWKMSDVDLSQDAIVVETDGAQIVAYAIVRRPGTLAAVAPEHEGQGIGTRMLRWSERREREKGRARHRQWISPTNARARALLRSAGYEPVRTYSRMVRRLDDVGAPGEAPAGVRLRSLDVDHDAATVHALDAASFAEVSDYEPESFDVFAEEHLRTHDLAPELSLVAQEGESTIGFLLARRWGEDAVGFVDILAVHPRHQGRGVGTALLRFAFAGFAAAGIREAQLGVASDNPRALRLYRRAGMTARFQLDTYERPVQRPA